MQTFKLPLTPALVESLELPETAEQLLKEDQLPTRLIFHALSGAEEFPLPESLISSFNELLKIEAVCTLAHEKFWVLSAKRTVKKQSSGAIYIPVNLDLLATKPHDPERHDMNAELRLALGVLKHARDSIDYMREPFRSGGLAATDYVDFGHKNIGKSVDSWRNAVVFYTSLGGDALIVNLEGETAWFQIETHEITPVGSFGDAVKRYFEWTIDDREFSSWTDHLKPKACDPQEKQGVRLFRE